jgi:phosphatidylserine synthase
MNEMYNMSIVTHNYGVMAILGVIFVNMLMLFAAKDISKYTRAVRIFMPIGSTMIGFIIFTGVVMMAAKHLDFTIANIAMIIFAIILIYLEVKRSSKLKYLNRKEENAFKKYKLFAVKILLLEIVVTLSISFWMWM